MSLLRYIYLDASLEEHHDAYQWFQKNGSVHLRSLAMFGHPSKPRFASVWVSFPHNFTDWRARHAMKLDSPEYAQFIDTQTAAGRVPKFVAATGAPGQDPVFTEAWVAPQDGEHAYILHGIPDSGVGKHCDAARKKNYYLRWSAVYPSRQGERRHALLFWRRAKNRVRTFGFDLRDKGKAMENAVNAHRDGWASPQLICPFKHGYFAIWHDCPRGDWKLRLRLNKSELELAMAALAEENYFLDRVQVHADNEADREDIQTTIAHTIADQLAGSPNATLYSAIFVRGDGFARKRHFTTRAPPGHGMVDGDFDKLMKTVMRHYDIPGAQLAIAHEGKLLYARAFTFAEEGYEVCTLETPLRLASVSKAITTTAMMKLTTMTALWPAQPANKQDVFLNDILKIRTLDGSAQVDPGFKEITIKHLASHTSGWLQATDAITGEYTSRDFDWGGSHNLQCLNAAMLLRPLDFSHWNPATEPLKFPVRREWMESWIAGFPGMLYVPNPNNLALPNEAVVFEPNTVWAYSGADSFFLARAILKLMNAKYPSITSYESAVQRLLLDGLNIRRFTHTGEKARTRHEFVVEPKYHMGAIYVFDSILEPTAVPPLVTPGQYTGNPALSEANGAWIAPAIDVVRLLASFHISMQNWAANPIGMSSEIVHDMLYKAWNTRVDTNGQNQYVNEFDGNPVYTQSYGWFMRRVSRLPPELDGVPQRPPGTDDVTSAGHNGATGGGRAEAYHTRDGFSVVVMFSRDFTSARGPALPFLSRIPDNKDGFGTDDVVAIIDEIIARINVFEPSTWLLQRAKNLWAWADDRWDYDWLTEDPP
jgi:CubicO group peptidase (beta-lactamase class C family)